MMSNKNIITFFWWNRRGRRAPTEIY